MTILQRREFIAGLGGAAAWPLAARAQQGDRVRRIGVLMPYDENDGLDGTQRYFAFTQALAGLGWTDGGKVRIDIRWHGDDPNVVRTLAHGPGRRCGMSAPITISRKRSQCPMSTTIPFTFWTPSGDTSPSK